MNHFLYYANAGFSVIPIQPNGTKAPAIASWNPYRERIASEAELQQWHESGYGPALVGGNVSGGLEIIDIDDPSLAKPFVEAVDEADPTIVNRVAFIATPRKDPETGKSGCHVIYRCTNPAGNTKLAMTEPLPQFDENGEPTINQVTSKQTYRPETLIETRGEGGYVLTVGCPAECHPSGGLYEHRYGCELHELEPLSQADRSLLHQAARGFDRSVVEQHRGHDHETGDNSPGNAYAAATAWEQILEPHGWRKAGAAGETVRWRRPGKDRGWSATTGLISQNGAELFCVFSSNAHPFEGGTTAGQCSTHSKFDAYTRLNFDGDHSTAAKHLASQGFGDPPQRTEPPKPIVLPTWQSVADQYIDEIESGGIPVLETGIGELDLAVGGFAYGEVVVIAGAPSHGKTMLALQCADSFSRQGVSSVLLNEEMNFGMLGKRRLQMASELTEDEWDQNVDRLRESHRVWSEDRSPVYLSPPCGTIDAAIRTMDWAHDNEIRVVVVDYAQLLRGDGNGRYEQVSDVSQKVRETTSRHGLLTILLAQLNRNSRRERRDPGAEDIRDSGQIEQDADVVLTIQRPYLLGSTDCQYDDLQVGVVKNRNRETRANKVNLKVDLRRQRITDPPIETYEWDPSA